MHTQILAISFKIEAISFIAQKQCVIHLLIHFNQLNYKLGYTMIILGNTIYRDENRKVAFILSKEILLLLIDEQMR